MGNGNFIVFWLKVISLFSYSTGYVRWFTVGILQISSVDNMGSKGRKPCINPVASSITWIPVGDQRLDKASPFRCVSLLFHKGFVSKALQRKLPMEEVETANTFSALCHFHHFHPSWLQLRYSFSHLTWFSFATIDQFAAVSNTNILLTLNATVFGYNILFGTWTCHILIKRIETISIGCVEVICLHYVCILGEG